MPGVRQVEVASGSTDPMTTGSRAGVVVLAARTGLGFRLPHAPSGRRPHAVHVPTPVAPALERGRRHARLPAVARRPRHFRSGHRPLTLTECLSATSLAGERDADPHGGPEPLETNDRLCVVPSCRWPVPIHLSEQPVAVGQPYLTSAVADLPRGIRRAAKEFPGGRQVADVNLLDGEVGVGPLHGVPQSRGRGDVDGLLQDASTFLEPAELPQPPAEVIQRCRQTPQILELTEAAAVAGPSRSAAATSPPFIAVSKRTKPMTARPQASPSRENSSSASLEDV